MSNSEINEFGAVLKGFSSLNWVVTSREFEFIDKVNSYLSTLAMHKSNSALSKIFIYDIFAGLRSLADTTTIQRAFENPESLPAAPLKSYLKFLNSDDQFSTLIIKDAHIIKDSRFWRCVAESLQNLLEKKKKVIFLSPFNSPPLEFIRIMYVYNDKLPNFNERLEFLDLLNSESIPKNMKFTNSLENFAKLSAGLTEHEIKVGIRKCVAILPDKNIIDSKIFQNYKEEIIKKHSKVNFLKNNTTFDDLGGLDVIKEYIINRFSKKHLQKSGIILLGVPGAGKTAFASALANHLNIPGVYLEMSSIFNKSIGDSEKAIKSSLDIIDAIGDCVVILDEIEKVLGGVVSSNRTDGGTVNRVFETLLDWLNKKDRKAYVIATSNDIDDIPVEFTRTGRWDTTFFFDIPDEFEAKIIFQKKCKLFNIDNWEKHYEYLLEKEMLKNITGEEINQLVLEYCYTIDEKTGIGNWNQASKYVIKIFESQKEKIQKIQKNSKKFIRASESKIFISEKGLQNQIN